MFPRYYIFSAIVVLALTAGISIWKQKRTGKEIAMVFFQVVIGFGLVVAGVVGIAKLMEILGIAKSGFML